MKMKTRPIWINTEDAESEMAIGPFTTREEARAHHQREAAIFASFGDVEYRISTKPRGRIVSPQEAIAQAEACAKAEPHYNRASLYCSIEAIRAQLDMMEDEPAGMVSETINGKRVSTVLYISRKTIIRTWSVDGVQMKRSQVEAVLLASHP
jgi:hypothetical protein